MKNLKTILCLSTVTLFSGQVVFAAVSSAAPVKTEKKETVTNITKNSAAEPLALKISGTITAQAGGVKQKDNSNGKAGAVNFQIPTSDLYFKVYGKTDSGYRYGYVTRLQAITNSVGIKRSYIEVSKDDIGSFEIGNVKGVDDKFGSYGAYGLLGGTGGINGSAGDYYNFSEGTIKGTTIIGSPGVGTKINYTSPTVNGFTAGLSFTPNTTHTGKMGRDNTRSQSNSGDDGNEKMIYPNEKNYGYGINNVTMALKYEGEHQEHRFGGDFVYITESPIFSIKDNLNYSIGGVFTPVKPSRKKNKLQKTNSWMASLNYGYDKLDVAANYLNNKKSRYYTKELEDMNRTAANIVPLFPTQEADGTPYVCEGNAGRAWNIGSSYKFGSYKAALGYFNTSRKTHASGSAKVDAVTATLDLKALEGLTFFGEVTGLRTKTNETSILGAKDYELSASNGANSPIGNNKGAVFIVGTKVSF
ncbi:MAG: hypothetical protein C0432_01485 [Candidatus Puniceispirillum sp.]|nr:hypothetical protein [Candidatus Pelagibacter sp.]MBA4282953.1 hypothetical protein [Candidatus Puniceispirillum sp.]